MSITYTITRGTISGNSGVITGTYTVSGSAEVSITESYNPSSVNVPQGISFGPPGSSPGNLLAFELLSTASMTITTNGAGSPDVQTISITGTPTGGSFPIQFAGQTTEVVFSASASAVQTALQGLSTIGSGNVVCTGGPLPGTPVVCTFAASMATGLKPLMTVNSGSLTGGTTPVVSVAHTTPGLPQDILNLAANVPIQWDSQCGLACPFAGGVTEMFVTCTSAATLQVKVLVF